MSNIKQFCTFYLGERLFGLEVLKVQEVIKHQEMTDVPLAPSVLTGLINLRGSIVSCIDLRKRLGMAAKNDQEELMNVVTQTSTGLLSLQVDRIGDVVEVTGDSFEPPPDTVGSNTRKLLKGVYKLPQNLLLVLDMDQVADV